MGAQCMSEGIDAYIKKKFEVPDVDIGPIPH